VIKNVWLNAPGRVIAFVEAVLALVIAFGLQLSGEQVAAIVAVTTMGLGLLTDKVAVSREALNALAERGDQ